MMARQRSLFQTSAFRGALVYLVVFLAVTGATLGFLYNEMARALSRSGDALVWQEAAVVSRLHAAQGVDTLKDFVTARGTAGGEMVYFLADGLGTRLAGNLSAFPAPDRTRRTRDDWITFDVPLDSERNRPDAFPVRGRVIVLDNDLALLVARDVAPERAQLLAMARMFGGAMLVLVLIGLAGSIFMARRTLARVDIISDSLRDIMQGRFETRVALAGRGDEMTLLADRLNDMTARINTLMSAMREVTDNIAHDLRTPLNRLRGQLENTRARILETDISGTAAGEMDEQLAQSIHDIDMLLENFAAMLSLSRLESGAVARSGAEVDLAAVVADIAELYEPVVQDAGARLNVVVHDKSARISGERSLVSQAIANLLENALKYGDGGENIGLELSRRQAPDGVFYDIAVRDCGPGIAAADRARAMARFVRLEPSRHLPGSGIGLSLVHAIAQVHGGALVLSDNLPHGLVATLSVSAGER
ncbi:MAG: sensor histidine kinase [Parvibaculales bacterium]